MSARVAWIVLLAAPALAAQVHAEPLSLAQAVRRAAGGAAPVRIAELSVAQGEARGREARAALLPSLSATTSQSERTYNLDSFGIRFGDLPPLVGPVPTFDARVRATQTIADVSAWQHAASARAGVDAVRADARTRAPDAAQDAALRYAAATRARATRDARRADLRLATELDSLARIQLSAGTAANIDLLRARTQLVTARGELVVAEDAFERARIDLARALGAPVDTPFELTDSLGGAVASDAPESRDGAVALAQARRAELAGERARLQASRRERAAAAAEWLPRVDVAADYGASGLHVNDAIATRDVAVALTWPLFDGARREARVREQTALLQQSEVRARDLSDQIAAEVEEALLDLGSGRAQERIAAERMTLALQQLTEARIRFRNGAANNLEVIEAQSAVIRARDADIAARAATAVASIHLARAAGVAETVR